MNDDKYKNFLQILPVTHSVAMKIGLPIDSVTVKAMISVIMAKETEGGTGAPTKVCFVLDKSYSTNEKIKAESGQNKIYQAIASAAIKTINQMGDQDEVAVVAFDDSADIIAPLTPCSLEGKERVIGQIEACYFPNGGTNYTVGLEKAVEVLSCCEGKKVIIFVSDGQHQPCYPDPANGQPSLAEKIRESGVSIYTAAVSDNLAPEDEKRLINMSGGHSFKAAITGDEIAKYFAAAFKKASRSAVTNAELTFASIGLVQKVLSFELVHRNGKMSYVEGIGTERQDGEFAIGKVLLGDIAPGDRIDCLIRFQTRLPKFGEGVTERKNSFGALTVQGLIPADGVNDVIEIGSEEMYQWFKTATSGVTNSAVDIIDAAAEGARAMDAASKTSNVIEQNEILDAAAKKMRQTMVDFGDEDDGTLTDALNSVQSILSSSQNATERQKAAKRQTLVEFDEEDLVEV